jgi:integrase
MKNRFKPTKDPEIFQDTRNNTHWFRGTPIPGKGSIMRSLKVKTFGLAVQAKKTLLIEIRGIDPRARGIKIGDLLLSLEKEKANLSKSTLNKCRAAQKSLNPYFENLLVTSVNREHVDEFVSLSKKQSPTRKLENDILHLNMVMKRAYEKGLIPRPLTFKNPDKRRQKKRSPTPSEIAALYEFADSHELKRFILIESTMGPRPGETLSLEWSEVELDTGFVTILAEKNKNNRQRRIAMSPAVWENLKQWRFENNHSAVFVPRLSDQEKPWLMSIDHQFERAVDRAWKAGRLVKNDITPNSLRHYFATQCARQINAHKTDILRVCEYLDHSLDTYKEWYLDLNEEDTRHVASLVEEPK